MSLCFSPQPPPSLTHQHCPQCNAQYKNCNMQIYGCLRICYYASWQDFANMKSTANLNITVRTASTFCARSRSPSKRIFDLDQISYVISRQWEPWPGCYCIILWYRILNMILHFHILVYYLQSYRILCDYIRVAVSFRSAGQLASKVARFIWQLSMPAQWNINFIFVKKTSSY